MFTMQDHGPHNTRLVHTSWHDLCASWYYLHHKDVPANTLGT
jgi:hypothetical protein